MPYQEATSLPDTHIKSGGTKVMNERTVLKGILDKHALKAGSYGKLTVLKGSLDFQWEDTMTIISADAEHPIIIPPERLHKVIITQPVEFHVDFYREA